MGAAKQIVDEGVKQAPIVAWVKTGCPYCSRAKATLESKVGADNILETDKNPTETDKKVVLVHIRGRSDMDDIQDYLLSTTKSRSVPSIFMGGQYFGGNDTLQSWEGKGDLDQKLKEVGAL